MVENSFRETEFTTITTLATTEDAVRMYVFIR